MSRQHHFIWLGRQDSNLRMRGSKPRALPLGDVPVTHAHPQDPSCSGTNRCARGQDGPATCNQARRTAVAARRPYSRPGNRVEPANRSIKSRIMPTRRCPKKYPSRDPESGAYHSSALSKGDRLTPRATNPSHGAGILSATTSACALLANAANTQPPVPVICAGEYSASQSRAAATSG